MFVKATVSLDTNVKDSTAITIPASAVLWTGKRSVVYLKVSEDEPVFEMKEVLLGNKIGEHYQVLEGLFSGNEIVTNGTFTLDAAAQLQGKRSMMNQEDVKKAHAETAHESKVISSTTYKTIPETFKTQLTNVYTAYLPMKNALVNDQFEAAKAQANSIEKALEKVSKTLLTKRDAKQQWSQVYNKLQTSLKEIKAANDIDNLRTSFKLFSETLAIAIQEFGTNQKVYLQFCPMANNNNGAYWLSDEAPIKNPYFGAMMLSCGSVEKEIN